MNNLELFAQKVGQDMKGLVKDTGWRRINTPGLKEGYIALRRVGARCYITLTGGAWGTVTLLQETDEAAKENGRFNRGSLRLLKPQELPLGFRCFVSVFQPMAYDGKAIDGLLYLGGNLDENCLMVNGYKDIAGSKGKLMRAPMLFYPTNDPWPTELPGYPL